MRLFQEICKKTGNNAGWEGQFDKMQCAQVGLSGHPINQKTPRTACVGPMGFTFLGRVLTPARDCQSNPCSAEGKGERLWNRFSAKVSKFQSCCRWTGPRTLLTSIANSNVQGVLTRNESL